MRPGAESQQSGPLGLEAVNQENRGDSADQGRAHINLMSYIFTVILQTNILKILLLANFSFVMQNTAHRVKTPHNTPLV